MSDIFDSFLTPHKLKYVHMKQDKFKNNIQVAIQSSKNPSTNNSSNTDKKRKSTTQQPKEYGGRKDGLDPTRYGDWEKNGRCIDF